MRCAPRRCRSRDLSVKWLCREAARPGLGRGPLRCGRLGSRNSQRPSQVAGEAQRLPQCWEPAGPGARLPAAAGQPRAVATVGGGPCRTRSEVGPCAVVGSAPCGTPALERVVAGASSLCLTPCGPLVAADSLGVGRRGRGGRAGGSGAGSGGPECGARTRSISMAGPAGKHGRLPARAGQAGTQTRECPRTHACTHMRARTPMQACKQAGTHGRTLRLSTGKAQAKRTPTCKHAPRQRPQGPARRTQEIS